MRTLALCTLGALAIACGGDDAESSNSTSGAVGSGSTSAPATTEPVGSSSSPSTTGSPTSSTSQPPATDSASTDGTDGSAESGTSEPGDPVLPPAGAGLDYQLGGAYEPPREVEVVSRDRNAAPAPALYNICYVNGYQTQPDEQQWWLDEHPDLLLRDGNGNPFIDPDWDEILLDITTAQKREDLAEIVSGWIDQCGADGYDAVEIDNLDTYSRSDGMISQDNAVDFMAMLSARSHAAGMAIAQKNSTEIADRQAEMGTDFAVAEECNRWDECQDYKDVYGELVFVIEYRAQDLAAGCANFPELSMVLRDLNLVTPGDGAYVYDTC